LRTNSGFDSLEVFGKNTIELGVLSCHGQPVTMEATFVIT
jgi:hypothetical protein